jgi:hypothetical protein
MLCFNFLFEKKDLPSIQIVYLEGKKTVGREDSKKKKKIPSRSDNLFSPVGLFHATNQLTSVTKIILSEIFMFLHEERIGNEWKDEPSFDQDFLQPVTSDQKSHAERWMYECDVSVPTCCRCLS